TPVAEGAGALRDGSRDRGAERASPTPALRTGEATRGRDRRGAAGSRPRDAVLAGRARPSPRACRRVAAPLRQRRPFRNLSRAGPVAPGQNPSQVRRVSRAERRRTAVVPARRRGPLSPRRDRYPPGGTEQARADGGA